MSKTNIANEKIDFPGIQETFLKNLKKCLFLTYN